MSDQNEKNHVDYQDALCSAKALATLIPTAIDGGATQDDIKAACYAVANLIEVAHADIEKNFARDVDELAAKLAAESAKPLKLSAVRS